MTKPKNSIPLKVLMGYLLLTAFGAATIWFIYHQTVKVNSLNSSNTSHKKLTLISEIATRLYDTEGISRNIIQDKKHSDLSGFEASIDTISDVLDQLKSLYPEKEARIELDSIHILLEQTGENLEELIAFRRKNASNNYYDRVLKRLENADYLFGSTDYKSMVKDLKPYQQKVIVDFLEYAEEDNANRLTNRTADSLINTMKQVLLTLELNEHNYQKSIAEKEQKLLVTGVHISNQLRKIRGKIEQEGVQNSLEVVDSQQKALHKAFNILILFGIASILTILAFVIIIVKDINKSRQYRLDLEKAKIYAEGLLKSREQLMNTVTHDLRSPISTILGYSNLLNKTTLDTKQKAYAKQLDKASDYTLRLVNDLLDFSRLDAGKIAIEKHPFIPEKLIRETLSVNIPSNNPKRLNIEVDADKACSNTYLSDPFRLQQILANLVGNAYKFTEEGFVKIKAEVSTNHKLLTIRVEDSGIGISKEQQKIIFNEFSQAETNTEKRFGGSGLGLAITKKLTSLLGGTIDVNSKPGRGSCFVITIPIQPTDKSISKVSYIKYKLNGINEKRVLLVDDDAAQLALITELLEGQGFSTSSAHNGKAALSKVKAEKFDIVFTDIQMPEMSGFELITKIREQNKAIPVIALSGAGDKEKSYYLEKGFTDYLLKPYQQNDILKIIATQLGLTLEEVKPLEKEKQDADALFDLSTIKSFVGEDKNSLQTIIDSFKLDLEKNLDRIKGLDINNLTDSDLEEIANKAHKMLPMSRQINAKSFIAPLEVLEKEIETLGKEALKKTIDQTLSEGKLLINALNNR